MQNRINDQAAFILHRRDYQDSSLILDLFTEQFGRLSVLVKGAKKRRDVASFQICNRLQVSWSGRSDLKLLTQVDCHVLSVSADFLPSVFYINELLLFLLPKHEEQQKLFQLYQMLLIELSNSETPLEPVLRNFEIELLTEMGYMPDLSVVCTTNERIKNESLYVFNEMSGVQIAPEGTLNTFCGADLESIHNRQFESTDVLRTAKRLMRQIIDVNLQGRTLQSRKFYQQMKKK